MSDPIFPKEVFFFSAILYRKDLFDHQKLVHLLRPILGELTLFDFSDMDFSLVNYYEKEMGEKENLKRVWLFCPELRERENLEKLKIQTNQLEKELQDSFRTAGRVINLDPGYLALEQVVLATGKPYSHRVYLQNGIYAELTYLYQQRRWETLPWTYPDYRQEEVKKLFEDQRNLLKTRLK